MTVPAVTAPNSVTVISAPCRLTGWSLVPADVAGLSSESSVTSPAALTAIAGLGTVPPGDYTVSWQVQLSGTPGAGDANNFRLQQAGAGLLLSDNPGSVGQWQQDAVLITIPAGGAVVNIVSVAAGTAGAVYTAQLSLTSAAGAEGQILDGSQVLAVIGIAQGSDRTTRTGDEGLFVSASLTVKATAGTISGALWVTDFDAHEESGQWPQTKSMNSP